MLSLGTFTTGRSSLKSLPSLEHSLAERIGELLDHRAAEAELAELPPEERLTLLQWATEYRVIQDKSTTMYSAFRLTDYPWLEHVYESVDKLRPGLSMVIRKGAQLGLTEFVINLSFYAIQQYGARVFYALPPGIGVVGDFAHDRVSPAIAHSPLIREMVGKIDNVGLKTFERGALYIRSTSVPLGRPDKAPQLASVPADVAIIDEVDRVPPAAIPLIRDRMGDSRIRVEVLLSTPTYPGVGIDAEYQRSDMREPFIQCDGCGVWHPLVWGLVENRDGLVALYCPACKEAIHRRDAWSQGRMDFRAQNPDSDVIGYWVSKLCSPRANLADLWAKSKSTEVAEVLAFHNNDLGVGYEPQGSRLTLELLRSCVGDYVCPDTAGWTAMGVDVGTVLNVWIMELTPGGRHRAVYISEVLSWYDLDMLMKRYGVGVCVVDDGPELTADLEFVRRWRGKAFLANYTDSMPGRDWCMFDVRRQHCRIDRTAGLDRSHGNIEGQIDMLPRNFEMIPDFVQQMTVNLKTKGIKPDGTVFYHFPRTGKADHYDHAKVYAEAALERLQKLRSPGQRQEAEGKPAAGQPRYRGRV